MKLNYTLSTFLASMVLAACSSTPMTPAPVVERSLNGVPMAVTNPSTIPAVNTTAPRPATDITASIPAASTSAPSAGGVFYPKPVIVIDGKTYTVKKGDTLFAIALESGVSYRDLAEWNGITNPSYIQVDQVLRLSSPAGSAPVAAVGGVAQSSPVAMPGQAGTVTAPSATPATPSPPAPAGDVVWQWPSKGKLVQGFVDGKSKGVDIAGNLGDPIVAAADGKVVYAGSALKGYGQLLIVKHSEVYLTAYAHNSKLLVREDAQVKRGQKIAEMGNTESDNGQIKLHFELRRSGKPTDPVKLLPAQ
jgi:lipoprotein NlpD